MIYVSEIQGRIVEYLKSNPDSPILSIAVAVGKQSKQVGTVLSVLMKTGLLSRSGKEKHYRYRYLGVPYKVGIKPLEVVPVIKGEDRLLSDLAKVDLTDDQIAYIKGHAHLSRQQLARKLGISKIELNQAMDRRHISSKYRPKHIDMSEDE